ncbi:MAG: M20/M25/M40 family metallo-hydrolase [Lentisphaerae bacterium]|nr:M20/M25/M40 family metallo-hydrolase [Lentisphaerota bacterium]
MKEKIAAYASAVQGETEQIIRDICAIPAPSHHEERRAEFCKQWFLNNGFSGVEIDEALNVVVPVNMKDGEPITVIMAHTDTVFPDMEQLPFSEKDGFMYSPGVTDDTANLAVMMVGARFFKENLPADAGSYLFVANSCEEGLGNLKGSRKIMEKYGAYVKEFVSLDSSSMNRIVTLAVGSHRYKVTVRTEGGHSFSSFGNRNAIHVLSNMINVLYSIKVPVEGKSKTTYNVGLISGGTSVNTIAQEAEMMYEYRSDNRICLAKMENFFNQVIETFRAGGIDVTVEKIGDRPCSGEIDEAKYDLLKQRIHASMQETLGDAGFEVSSSTDCNVPLSMGIPAICFGVCRGGKAHTREEFLETASLSDGCRLFLDFLYRK